MFTRPDFKLYFLLSLSCITSTAAWAIENVDWPTYYPSPYGEYRKIKTTETASLGTQPTSTVLLATGGGLVGVGVTAPTKYLEARSPAGVANLTMTASFLGANGWGVQVGGFKNGAGALQSLGGIQAYQRGGAASGPLVLNPGGTNVVVGSVAAPYDLTVGQTGKIAFTRGGNMGEYKVAKGSDNNYYAAFAPG